MYKHTSIRKLGTAAFLALSIALAAGGTALADDDDDREPISSVSLYIESEITTGSSSCEVDVDTEDEEYSVGGVEVVNASGTWTGGTRPKLEIYLYADDDYYFASAKESMFDFYGEDAEFVSATREEDKSELVLVVKLDALDEEDLDIDDASWDTSSGTASWDRASDAQGYEVRLYRGSSLIDTQTTRSASSTSYNFSGMMKESGSYYFKVRAVGSGSVKGDWTTSGKLQISSGGEIEYYYDDEDDDDEDDDKEYSPSSSSSTPTEGDYSDEDFDEYWDNYDDDDDDDDDSDGGSSASTSSRSKSSDDDDDVIAVYEKAYTTGGNDAWRQDQYGWWFQMEDDTYPADAWVSIDGKWYCFDENGYLRYGWIESDGEWYYCEDSGAMMENAKTPDGYYVGGNGAWIH